ncbi:hypothetical protein TNCV_4876301 [Trichonephila clavipes]|uniref:Uncharacterized protein n=1 Tax=Trichonephila clavipes TaxID=2585209 RepID=A0A8X6UYR0_TRICX|nr:hypothetical protein TNCV_4876301 [Trichonephila clavipes]
MLGETILRQTRTPSSVHSEEWDKLPQQLLDNVVQSMFPPLTTKGGGVSLLSSGGETLPLLSSPTNYDATRKITSPSEYSMSGHIRRDFKDHQRYNLMRILESK